MAPAPEMMRGVPFTLSLRLGRLRGLSLQQASGRASSVRAAAQSNLGEHPDAPGQVWHLPNDPDTRTTRQVVDIT